ncbi:MAG TPA: queuosine precursor transporter [Pyrinomonadaceae bacterium]|nr:queuosine precursor transporter [Pyrinomonadaceae bacterium]
MGQRSGTRETAARRVYRYYDLVTVAFVTVLLCSSLIGVGKVSQLGGYSFGTAVIFFPISYIFGDILTEVYGYARTRRVIWAGFAALGFASLMSWAVIALPPAPGWPHQEAYVTVYGQTPRIVAASLTAFWAGDFVNSYVLARLKLKTEGRFLWLRTIGSTVVGQGVDSLIFYPLAFLGEWPAPLVLAVMTSNFFVKVGVEAVMTPVTYKVVGFLKRAEGEDYYDRGTDFNPFKLET